ncbi:Rad9-domain-containing protein [Mucor mucedo]|uniref:Rad9-domain-containing protein n=1 Tax=Mucor mucedo TaxID=29922 RepID=UPI00221F3511|nr:Rad9-domain-containing protein [Mucor mucedo]KAI7894860.1 Rad9-domain-containing protein [Mucor mucedo]
MANIASINTCHLSIIQGSAGGEGQATSQMAMQLNYTKNLKKTNTFTYTDGDSISALYSADNLHHFVMSAELIKDCFSRFDPRVSDILLKCTPHSITVSTYTDPNKNIRSSRYAYTIDSGRCSEYSVIDAVKIVCNLKEFHAVVDFMDHMDTPIHASFEDVGKPILFTYRIESKVMLDVALMSQMDETENNESIPTQSVQIPNIREPVSSRPFGHSYNPTQSSQPSRDRHRDISSLTTAPPETPYNSLSESPELPSRPDPPRTDIHNTVSVESMPSLDSLHHQPNEQRTTRQVAEPGSASQRLTTLQMLREKKRQSMYQDTQMEMGSPIYDRTRNTTPESRSSLDLEDSAPYIKEEGSSRISYRRGKKRPCINEDSD